MQTSTTEQVIERTKKWITNVVIGCNFCPFAAREVKQNTIHFQVENRTGIKACLHSFEAECVRLDNEANIETTLLIFPKAFLRFRDYLGLVTLAENLIKNKGYKGIYQVATFHPDYAFAGSPINDAANYTNRSIYPMLHLLREASIENALKRYSNSEDIPKHNISFARDKGTAYMKMLRDSCM